MEFRDARADDVDGIVDVASRSLRDTYGDVVAGDRLDALVDERYDPERVADELDSDVADWIVAVDDDEVLAVAQIALLEADAVVGELHWLHVAPDAGEPDLSQQLLGHAQEAMADSGAAVLRGLVLSETVDRADLYESNGFDRVDEREVTIGEETYSEYVYEKRLGDAAAEAVVEPVDGPEGELFADYSGGERGTKAPFYPTFRSRDLAERYGWYCANCESTDNAMDTMGHVECNDCGNRRKATRWDASYL